MILMGWKIDIGDIKRAILVVILDSNSSEGSEKAFLVIIKEESGFFKDFCGLKIK